MFAGIGRPDILKSEGVYGWVGCCSEAIRDARGEVYQFQVECAVSALPCVRWQRSLLIAASAFS